MRVTMKTLSVTPKRTLQPGQNVDLPRDEAEALIKGRFAVPADEDPASDDDAPARRGRRARRSDEG
ncbi:hypothetical protein [Amycolatopsis palatopharyngis]|uniref:hypothetical protein n=1 Tax=Amycolatopsis palatopharyngis TaxID=187982 RepID=UPI000E24A600|nr:hypothetical protein [Amycolatopsis palatopharyngis]